jgi:polyphosphate kinase
MYVASADWMTRNLSRRVEVAIPVYDAGVRAQLQRSLEIQLADNTKARVIDQAEDATRTCARTGAEPVRAQEAFRDYLASLAEAARRRLTPTPARSPSG